MASFSHITKTEICSSLHANCRKAFLTGVLLSARRISENEIIIQTECEAFAALLPQLISETDSHIQINTEFRNSSKKQAIWNFQVNEKADIQRLLKKLNLSPANRQTAVCELTDALFPSAAAGCFVANGSITDPERGYHMEMVFSDHAAAEAIRERMNRLLPTIHMKQTVRKNDTVLYLKQNEQICDALTFFGAQNASLSIVELQIYKSFVTQTNRRTNCDLANIDKSIAAASQQLEHIQLIADTVGLHTLPESLQEVAALRIANPEASLQELCALCHPPLSRSGIHHRMKRITELAARYAKSSKEK
ncbi:MAG: DNA-binding protein WhiA [Oscillospiraceae bacterium]|nr:DNA-binding protein WhiA [Oscillospiraceae bacterium]